MYNISKREGSIPSPGCKLIKTSIEHQYNDHDNNIIRFITKKKTS